MGSRPRVGKYKRFTETPKPDRYAVRVKNSCCLGISTERIAAICHVDISTARNWKAGRTRVPYAAQALLEGNLGAISHYWAGWFIDGEFIRSPDQWRINRNDALSVPLLLGQIAQREATIKTLEDTIAYLRSVQALEDQPSPGALPDIAQER